MPRFHAHGLLRVARNDEVFGSLWRGAVACGFAVRLRSRHARDVAIRARSAAVPGSAHLVCFALLAMTVREGVAAVAEADADATVVLVLPALTG